MLYYHQTIVISKYLLKLGPESNITDCKSLLFLGVFEFMVSLVSDSVFIEGRFNFAFASMSLYMNLEVAEVYAILPKLTQYHRHNILYR